MSETRAPLPPELYRALKTLQSARPLGLARTCRGFRGIAGHVKALDGQALAGMKLARIDYSGRYPRLKITRQGTTALTRQNGDDHA